MLNTRVEEGLDTLHGKPFGPYLTPPYLTALPDVVGRVLHRADGEEMRFLILGSDGREQEMDASARS